MNGSKGKVFLLSSEGVGYGEDMLGYQILATMLESLTKRSDRPAAIVCWNTGGQAGSQRIPSCTAF